MLIAFGLVVIGMIGIGAASLAAPLAALVGGLTKLKGMRDGGLPAGLVTWVAATAAGIVASFFGMSGDAGSGVRVFGAPMDYVFVAAPVAWVLAGVIAVAFHVAAKRRRDTPPPPR